MVVPKSLFTFNQFVISLIQTRNNSSEKQLHKNKTKLHSVTNFLPEP